MLSPLSFIHHKDTRRIFLRKWITNSSAIGLLCAPLEKLGSATPPPRPLPVASGSSPCLLSAGYLTVQTPLKVSFWTGTASARLAPLCTHSPISFAFRFRALPEPQSAVTVWLSPAVPVYWAGRVRTSLNPLGSQVRNGGISPVSLNGGAETLWISTARSTLPCSSAQTRASSRIALAVK